MSEKNSNMEQKSEVIKITQGGMKVDEKEGWRYNIWIRTNEGVIVTFVASQAVMQVFNIFANPDYCLKNWSPCKIPDYEKGPE